jgi:hypothetical protein
MRGQAIRLSPKSFPLSTNGWTSVIHATVVYSGNWKMLDIVSLGAATRSYLAGLT